MTFSSGNLPLPRPRGMLAACLRRIAAVSDTPPTEPPADWPATTESPVTQIVMRLLMALLSRYRVIGAEHIPQQGAFLFISNHMSFWDIPAANLPMPRGMVGLAAAKYQGTWLEPFFRGFALIWVEQFSADRRALRDAITVLKAGVPLGMAPEGTRSRTGQLIHGTSGAAFIATRADVPILPGAVWGTEKVLRRPRPLVTVRYGKPFRLPNPRAKGDELDAYAERMMCAIAALLPEQYHGLYRGNPLIDEMRQVVT